MAEIAERAGPTERTFFRHYTDKREVLFWGAGFLQDHILNAVLGAPATAAPLEAVVTGLQAAGEFFQGDPTLLANSPRTKKWRTIGHEPASRSER